MQIRYRLGLDLGTNSIGWALWELGADGLSGLKDAGVRIFSDGRESQKSGVPGESLAVQRREARGMRRRRDRLLLRKRALVDKLVQEAIWPDDPELRIHFSKWDPYHLRAKALTARLSPEELGRVLLHICQRRGFKSNRKIAQDDDGVNKARIKALTEALDREGVETLGEYLHTRKRLGVRFRKDSKLYPDRRHYLDEFRIIKDRQKKHFPKLKWDMIEHTVFYQRDLKPQPKGTCRFYPDQDRAYKVLPSTHRFRILQEVANLRVIDSNGESVELSHDERDLVYQLLENQKSLTFNALKRKLGTNCRFNLESDTREKLLGNDTSCLMRKPDMFGTRWDEFDDETQDRIVERIMEAEDEDELRRYFATFRLREEHKNALSEVTFPTGIARYSAVLHRECVRVMKATYCGYSDALAALGRDHTAPEGAGDSTSLPYYGEVLPESCVKSDHPNQNEAEAAFGKIGNPTVHIALNQLRKVINALLEKYGKPDEIVIELSRELKVGRQKLSEIVKEQNQNRKSNENLQKELIENYKLVDPSTSDREKLRYYRELGKRNVAAACAYCGKVISADELFTGGIEVEHILPFSRTLDDGRNNKTLAHRSCNQYKREKSPYEAFGHSPEGFNWQAILGRIEHWPKAKQWRFQRDAMERFEQQESGFLQRQLSDNAYIARIARRYLTAICPANKVWAVNGKHTAILRRKWDLNSILSNDAHRKNRSDHRHHAVDAAVIGLIDRSLVKKIADANRFSDGDRGTFKFNVPDFPGGADGRARVAETIKAILPSIKKDHGLQGRFYKETAYGRIKQALPIATEKLTEAMIPHVVPARVQHEVEEIVSELGLTKGRKKIKARYSSLMVLKELWVTSKPFIELTLSDLEVPAYENNTKGPSDVHLRKRLKEYVDNHPGADVAKALEDFSKQHRIRHVRYIPKNQQIELIPSSLDRNGVGGKGYELDDYAYVDIWMLPKHKNSKPKYVGVFVSRLEATQIAQGLKEQRRPHPAAKKLMRLYKQDTIAIQEDDGWKYYQIKGYATTTGKIDIVPIWQSDGDWSEKTNRQSLPSVYPRTKAQNHVAINAIWQRSKVKNITVHYDGTVR